ncbi:MAG: hypothetical protein H7Y88_07170 [Phycisphaerales bacterium]|nr:hypothetical protein [Phycisphaerales bacterium]
MTLPSLYVFSALTGCRLSFAAVLRLLVATVVVNLAVAASLGPILAFFTLSTTSYPFMIVLNVGLLGAAGFVALGFLLKVLRQLSDAARRDAIADAEDEGDPATLARAKAEPDSTYAMFYIWVIIYGLVGAQMGWLLRPFIGHPSAPFTWFRARTGNFFGAFFHHLSELLGVND